ncbi:Fatty acid-binding protein [Halotydeus destructor]|nr:Fatty acid-binding protein [Halotydeus destructor]
MAFAGTYKLTKSDNWDEFMAEMGVSADVAAKIKGADVTAEIIQDGDSWTLKLTSFFGTKSITFQLGQEFDEERSGGIVKSTVTQDGNTWTQVQVGDKPLTTVREFTDQGITSTTTCNGVATVQIFERQ